ncbi:HET-domain-containing protein [Stipitochalara longipes BDJ]|nr:HET-domain-containing protein [Stipitochalara longipes BDJ]
MRILSTEIVELSKTFDNWDTVPPYAILSHTWEQGEVLFRDITTDVTKEKLGWSKILGASVEAERLGIFYLWVDTCCIDKESSAELSQSINSMFAWYRDARICFAYLGDFKCDDVETFDMSRWWTRGWTLQELIAPVEVMFFAQDWTFVGLRSSSATRIAGITGIGETILAGGNLDKLHDFSVAEKFSWAATRRTTCGEDRAYSMMGIFGVNMAMIYGEGEQAACYRLQKEIFGVYPDHSIFAWDLTSMRRGI